MQQRRAEQVRRDIIRLCHAGLDARTLRIESIKRLRTIILIDLSFFTTVDPTTLLFTGAAYIARLTPHLAEGLRKALLLR